MEDKSVLESEENKNTSNKSNLKNNGLSKLWLGPLIAGAVAFGFIIGGTTVAVSQANNQVISGDNSREKTLHKLDVFAEVLARVNNDYVISPDQEKLIDAAINGMLASLDPHSSLMSDKDFTNMQQSTKGEYGGLGLEVTSEQGAVKVVSPMDGSPGAKAGLKAGDKIIAIDGVSILGLPLDQAVDKMRGKAGTSIKITVVREKVPPKVYTITREVIVLHPVKMRLEGNVGYVRISTFVNQNTTKELSEALDKIQKDLGGNLKGVIVDLRNNGGGLLDQAVGVTDLLMDRGEIVSTRGRNPDQAVRINGTAGEKIAGIPLVVLINEGSASASEIVAGALQDRKRATIIGTTSFGKGSVQSVIPISNGKDGALRLTTARYYTPSGRSIQGAGIEPDIEIASTILTKEDVERRRALALTEDAQPNALNNDSGAVRKPPKLPDDMPPENWKADDDYQLKQAIAILNQGLPLRPVPKAAVPNKLAEAKTSQTKTTANLVKKDSVPKSVKMDLSKPSEENKK